MHELGTKYKDQLGGTNTLPKSGCTPRSLEKPIKNILGTHLLNPDLLNQRGLEEPENSCFKNSPVNSEISARFGNH